MKQEIQQHQEPSQSIMLAGGDAFEHLQRVAKMFASSDLVPKAFKGNIANCTIALEMAHRIGTNPMAVMQSLDIIHGKPSWSAQFIIASINKCGRFSPLRFDVEAVGRKKVEYGYTVYEGDKKTRKTGFEEIEDIRCVAWALEKESGERLNGPAVTVETAVKEGWYTKTDSKWKTMPELMLRYRAATFFGRLYAPDILMGMQTADEVYDTDIKPVPGRVVPDAPAIFAGLTQPAAEVPAAAAATLDDQEFAEWGTPEGEGGAA